MKMQGIKMRQYANYRNLFWQSTDMYATASNLFAPYGTAAARGFGLGSGLFVGLGFISPPANIQATPAGNARLYMGTGNDGSNVFINQRYPYSRLTKYRVSVWVKHMQGVISGHPINISYGNCSGFTSQGQPATPQFAAAYPDTITNGEWHHCTHEWTTRDEPLTCFYGAQVFFIDTLLNQQMMAVWGAELYVLQPGPDFFANWPQYGAKALVRTVDDGIQSQP